MADWSGLDQETDFGEQFLGAVLALEKEGIGDHPSQAPVVGTTNGNDGDLREAFPHHGQELETTHVRHAQIGDDDVRKRTPKLH